jgi:hypothetical protein
LADFFGLSDLSARALLSESYRNAVAAAIFLAAATKHSCVPRFMILDDVTSSFDAGHQFALMDALRTLLRHGAVPDGLQFIILSHDTSLEKYFDKLNGTADWHHQKLHALEMIPYHKPLLRSGFADRGGQFRELFRRFSNLHRVLLSGQLQASASHDGICDCLLEGSISRAIGRLPREA